MAATPRGSLVAAQSVEERERNWRGCGPLSQTMGMWSFDPAEFARLYGRGLQPAPGHHQLRKVFLFKKLSPISELRLPDCVTRVSNNAVSGGASDEAG
jgi:hypothetical protein